MGESWSKERSQLAWIEPGTGCGDAAMVGVESKATDAVDGRFHQDDGWQGLGGNGDSPVALSRRSTA